MFREFLRPVWRVNAFFFGGGGRGRKGSHSIFGNPQSKFRVHALSAGGPADGISQRIALLSDM